MPSERESAEVTRWTIWRMRLDRAGLALGEAFTGWLIAALLLSIAPGVLYFALDRPDRWAAFTGTNNVPPDVLELLLARMLGSALVIGAIYALSISWHRHKYGGGVADIGRLLNRRLAFLGAAALLSPLLVPEWVGAHPFLTMILAVAAAGLVAISASTVIVRFPFSARVATIIAASAVALATIVYVYEIVSLQLAQHHGFRTQTYDLGIYVNCVWQTLHGNFLGSSFLRGGTHTSAHFDPILALVAPAYLIHEGAETLFVVQALLLASAVVPAYLIAARRGGPAFGVVCAIAFFLHPMLQGVNIFEFHSMSLSLPFILWAAELAERRAFKSYAVAIALLYLSREDMAVAAGCIGLYTIAFLKQPRTGAVTIVTAILYLLFAKIYGMTHPALFPPDTPTSYSLATFFEHIAPPGKGLGAILGSLFGNPGYLVRHMLDERRVLFMMILFAPMAMIPLLGGRRWIVVAYGLAVALLASRWAAFTLGYHYASVLVPGAFIVTPAAVEHLAKRLDQGYGIAPARVWAACGAAILTASVVMSATFGALPTNPRFTTGAAQWPLVRELSREESARYAAFQRLTRDIAPDATVAASALPLPHLAARDRIMELTEIEDAEWVVVVDEMITGAEQPFWNRVRRDPRFREVGSHGTLHVYRRAGP